LRIPVRGERADLGVRGGGDDSVRGGRGTKKDTEGAPRGYWDKLKEFRKPKKGEGADRQVAWT